MRTTPTRPKGAPQHQKIVKSLNSIEFEEWSFCGKTSDSIEFVQCQTVAQPLPDPCQPHVVARRVRLRQTVARSMSAACCCSQSAPAKSVPDLRQPHDVARRVRLSQTVARSTSARSQCCRIYVSRIVSFAELSDLCQPHSVARSVVRSMSVA